MTCGAAGSRWVIAVALLAAVAGCPASEGLDAGMDADVDASVASEPDAGDAGPPPDAAYPRREPWAEPPPIELTWPLPLAVEWLRDDAVGWRTSFDPGSGDPPRSRRGGIGVGNGVVYGFVGIGEPDLATLHEAVGPGYERGEGYFSDLTLEVEVAGETQPMLAQTQWRVRGTAIAVTHSRYEWLDVITADFAPLTRPGWLAPAEDVERSLVRRFYVVARWGAPEARVSWVAREPFEVGADGALRQTRDGTRTARLVALSVGASVEPTTRRATLTLGSLERYEQATGTLALVLAETPGQEAATMSALEADDVEHLLETTRDRWRARLAEGATLDVPEPLLEDLLDSLLVTVLAQQARNGAISPISRYTRTWLRDTIGPVLGLAALGHHDAMRAALDYLWIAIVANGDLRNSMSADLDVPDPLPTDPGFASLPPLTGRTRAEGPSWVTLAHDEAARWRADRADVAARYALLERAVVDQAIDADDLLPFSGDETYRTAMAVALGHPVAESFEEGFRSLEASALLAVAAERLAEHAEALAMPAEASTLRELSLRARSGADRTYERASDGALLPYLADEGGLAGAPFPEVSLTPAWLGYLDSDRARLRRSIEAVWTEQGTDEGFPIAPPDPAIVRALPAVARGGLYTGMSPAMFLGACARADLALGHDALDAMARTASSSGAYEEYQTFLDHGALLLAYEPEGTLGETPARHRPWESGIAIRAILDWLFGLEPTRLDADGTVHVRVAPHVPRGWERHSLSGARVGDARMNVYAERGDAILGEQRVAVARASGGVTPISVTLGVRVEASELTAVTLDGAVVPLASLDIERNGRSLRFDLPERPLAPEGYLEARIGFIP